MIVDDHVMKLTRWMADYYLCGWGQVLHAVVPAGVRDNAGTSATATRTVSVQNGVQRTNRQLKDGEEIKYVREPGSVADVVSDVSSLIPVLHDILDDVRRLTSGPIAAAAENANKLIETNSVVLQNLLLKMDHIAGDIDRITDSESDDIRRSIANVREITESVKTLVGTGQERERVLELR